MSCLDPAAIRRADEFAHQFASAQPFRHVEMPGFLRHELCERLLEDFPRFEDRHALNEMGEVGGKAVRMDVRDVSAAYRELDAFLQTPGFLDYVSRVTGIPDLLYDPDYVGGGTHENRDGQGLDAHVDFNYHPRTQWHRRLNLIVYLNPRWEAGWGGVLELHSDPWNAAQDTVVGIMPAFNTCAIFETTESSWHGFSQIRLPAAEAGVSRKSFAIYLYTRERPPQQTAPPHATIYVPDSMPDGLHTGITLDDDAVRDLAQRFSRLRTQLRYLYDREKRFGAQIQSLEHALGEARAAQRLELQGYATQPHGVRGLWPDGWAGAELEASFVPSRRTRRLKLELWSPPQLANGQVLQVELAGRRWSQALRPGMRTPVELDLAARPGDAVTLAIHAPLTWVPSADPKAGDQRALAYRVLGAVLEH
jgi:hypothetical protein